MEEKRDGKRAKTHAEKERKKKIIAKKNPKKTKKKLNKRRRKTIKTHVVDMSA